MFASLNKIFTLNPSLLYDETNPWTYPSNLKLFNRPISIFFLFFVLVAPQVGTFSFGDEPLNAGETASLTCIVAKGDFPLEISWMFNGQPVNSDSHDLTVSETGKRTKQLTIDSVNAKHAGEYTCVASNVAGSSTRSAVLIVNGIISLKKEFIVVDILECCMTRLAKDFHDFYLLSSSKN